MKNMSDQSLYSGSYVGLLKRLTRRVQQGDSKARVIELLQGTFDSALADEKIVLSRPEISRLARQVSRTVLAEIGTRIDTQSSDQLQL